MSIVSEEFTDAAFDALKVLDRALPLLSAVAVMLDPAAAPVVEPAAQVFSRLFEAVAKLRDTATLAELEANARVSTDATWQEAIEIRAKVDEAMAQIEAHLTKPDWTPRGL